MIQYALIVIQLTEHDNIQLVMKKNVPYLVLDARFGTSADPFHLDQVHMAVRLHPHVTSIHHTQSFPKLLSTEVEYH